MALTAEQIRELMAQAGNKNYDLNPGFGALANKPPVIPPKSDLSMTPGFQGGMGGFTPPIPGGGTPLGGGATQGGFGMGGGGFDPMAMQGGMGMTPDVGDGLAEDRMLPTFARPLSDPGFDMTGQRSFTPEPRLAEDRMMLPPFARPQAEFDPATGQMRVRQPKNYSLKPQQPQRFGTDPITGEEYGAGPVDKFPPRGAQYPGTISSMFGGRF
jgi:hypothetical protein